MSDDLHHECGVAALYSLDERAPLDVAAMMPSMLLDLQTRGQLAAGLSSYDPERAQLIVNHKDVGSVSEVFRMNHPGKYESIMRDLTGRAAIGHTRYATTGLDDIRYAQPFERYHGRRWKWFSFAFNGTLSNYMDVQERLLDQQDYHFTLNTDTELMMHSIARKLRSPRRPSLRTMMTALAKEFDGAYAIVFLDATGRMFVARDPKGIRPMSWAVTDGLFGAANESVALRNAGFRDIKPLEPGKMIILDDGKIRQERFAPKVQAARCFFEWIYFSNVASRIDDAGVYEARAESGRRLAAAEDQPIDEDCVVVPVPDTAKAAADSFAYHLKIPCMEGVIRNRYVGRTFIQGSDTRSKNAKSKYTPLPSILRDRRIFLVEDSVVRSTTLKTLVHQLREVGEVKEIHVRVACPPIIAPCFYGIDMSTVGELFGAHHLKHGYDGVPTSAQLARMAKAVGVDSIRYLTVPELGPSIDVDQESLCRGCVSGEYPTEAGNRLMERARGRKGLTSRIY